MQSYELIHLLELFPFVYQLYCCHFCTELVVSILYFCRFPREPLPLEGETSLISPRSDTVENESVEKSAPASDKQKELQATEQEQEQVGRLKTSLFI